MSAIVWTATASSRTWDWASATPSEADVEQPVGTRRSESFSIGDPRLAASGRKPSPHYVPALGCLPTSVDGHGDPGKFDGRGRGHHLVFLGEGA